MKKKFDPSVEVSEFDETGFVPVVDEPVEIPAEVSTETASLRLLNDAKRVLGGKTYLLMVTVDGPLRGYLVEESLVAPDIKAVQTIDISTAIEVYGWEQEVEKMLPDRETMKRNIILSFWRAGAIDRDAARQQPTRRRMYDSSYPYKLEE